MKKLLAGIVVLGGIAGAVAYKLKKEQLEKELLDQNLDLLSEKKETCCCHEETNDTCCCHDEENESCYCQDENKEACECQKNCACEDHENPITDEIDDQMKHHLDIESDSRILELASSEDNLDEERPIQHFVDFKTEEDMEAFKAHVIEKGYVVTRGENPLQLSVLHIAPINRSELLANVYYLANQAIKNHGHYEGWQSRKVL